MRGKIYVLSAFFLLLVFLFSINGYGTESRIGSMGGVGYYIRDNSNIFYFPSTIHNYSNQVVAELRTPNKDYDYSIGVHLPIGDNIFGVYLNRPLPYDADEFYNVASNLWSSWNRKNHSC